MTIKTIIWGLAGVLLHPTHGTFNSLLAERLGAPLEAVDRVMGSPEDILWDLGEIDDDAFYTHVLCELNIPLDKKAIIAKFVVEDFHIDLELLDKVRELHKTYYSLLLTNFPYHLHKFLRTAWHVNGAFDHIIASCDVKLIKPDPRIYYLALERAACRAEEAVFIDDREVNVRAAEKLGIQGILYQNADQTINDLIMVLNK